LCRPVQKCLQGVGAKIEKPLHYLSLLGFPLEPPPVALYPIVLDCFLPDALEAAGSAPAITLAVFAFHVVKQAV
jgi:hypothetical protein